MFQAAVITIVILTLLVLGYFLPSILARKKQDAGSIQRLNLWLGWTGIGWLAALIWAVRSVPRQSPAIGRPAMPGVALRPDRFADARYTFREEVRMVGRTFHVKDSTGQPVLSIDMKPFKLREDIRCYAAEDGRTEVFTIKARQILDAGATYDVVDPMGQRAIGSLRRLFLRSLLRDEWVVVSDAGIELLRIQEDSLPRALLRRVVGGWLLPASYAGTANGRLVCRYHQAWNPFVMNLAADFSDDINRVLDRRLGLAAAVLLCSIEGKQERF